MNRTVLPVGLLCSALALLLSLSVFAADREAGKDTDKEQLQQVWTAIMAYKKAYGHLPDYLSNLVPEFLPNGSVLLSPLEAKKKRDANDPNLPTSYSYEFSVRPFGNRGRTFRELKEDQMKEFGAVIPILRCFAHGRVMNIAYSGDYYESDLFWERSTEAKELGKKLGMGPGFDDGDFAEVQVVDDQTGQGIAGAEVQLTRRQYHFLALPDRTLKTDADGKVRVPLGPAQPPSRRLTVSILKAGYFAPPETWLEGALPAQKTFRLSPASTIGGVVKDHAGAPVPGAVVTVSMPAPEETPAGGDPQAQRMVRLQACATDETGRWRCVSVPKDFLALKFGVQHQTAWPAMFQCGDASGPGAIDREALLAESAEFPLEPAAAVAGVVLGPDGSPLVGEDVTITVRTSRDEESRPVSLPPGIPKTTHLKTDAAGLFSMPWRVPAELMVRVAPRNLSVAVRAVTAAPGLEPIQIRVTTPRRITGQVHDSDGKAIRGVKVTFIGWVEASVKEQVATTDANGEFAWDAAPGDQIGLVFSGAGFSPSTEWVAADKKEPLQVELRSLNP